MRDSLICLFFGIGVTELGVWTSYIAITSSDSALGLMSIFFLAVGASVMHVNLKDIVARQKEEG